MLSQNGVHATWAGKQYYSVKNTVQVQPTTWNGIGTHVCSESSSRCKCVRCGYAGYGAMSVLRGEC